MRGWSGGGGIRTRGPRERTPVFKTGAFDRSATPPGRRNSVRGGAGRSPRSLYTGAAHPRRGGRAAEGTRLLSEYGVHTPSRVRIPPSPLPSPARHVPQQPLARLGNPLAPVAQLDRASVYGTEGQRFESSRARSEVSCAGGDFPAGAEPGGVATRLATGPQ